MLTQAEFKIFPRGFCQFGSIPNAQSISRVLHTVPSLVQFDTLTDIYQKLNYYNNSPRSVCFLIVKI